MDLDERIRTFRASVASNLLAERDFIDWGIIEQRLANAADSIARLQALVNSGPLTELTLAQLMQADPSTYPLLLDLIAFNSSGAQVEKWGLPQAISTDFNRTHWVAGQLLHIGVGKLLTDVGSVEAQLRLAEVHKDSYRRRFRSAGKLEQRTALIVREALTEANRSLAQTVSIDANALTDQQLRRSLTYVLAVGNRPIAGIATVFQNQSGGRQQRDLSITYPNLQSRLEALGMALILIADGQGLKEASDRTLAALFEGVRYPMTLSSAQDGALAEAIAASSTIDTRKTVDQAALNELIAQGLQSRLEVKAEDLPVDLDQGRLALAYFVEGRRKIALRLDTDGSSVTWAHREWVERARGLKVLFNPMSALDLFAEMLGLGDGQVQANPNGTSGEYPAPPTQPFADLLHVTANSAALTNERAREISQQSMEVAPGSPMAIYLTSRALDANEIQSHRKAQIFLPTNIMVISPTILEDMARHRHPLERFMDALLEQSDLTKVSPYILNNATPARMFYGREREAATCPSSGFLGQQAA